jgi:hypothetical protein
MPSPPNVTAIPAPRVPLIDDRTGLLSREWYRFFFNLFNLTGSGGNEISLQDLQVGPPGATDDQFAISQQVTGALATPDGSAQESQIAVLQTQNQALALAPDGAAQAEQIAVLQNQVQALALTPPLTPQVPYSVYGSFYSTYNQLDGSTTTAYPIVYDVEQTLQNMSLEIRTVDFTASIGPASTTMTVTAISAGQIYPGMVLFGTGVTAGTYIVSQTTGVDGSTGTYVVSVAQTVGSTSITGTCRSKLVVYKEGTYNIQFSIQFVNTDANIHDTDVWLRKNGINVVDSNSQFSVPNRHGGVDGHLIGALNLFVDLAPNDYVELMWATTNSGATIQAIGAQTGPVRPATPSVIVTVSLASVPSIQGV